MKKPKTKQRNVICAPESDGADPLDWAPLFKAFDEAAMWALDVAVQLARDYPEDVEAVERVRTFMRKRIAGIPAHVRIDDVLFTFGLVIGAIERDLGPVGALGPWFAPLHLPSAAELWERSIPRRFTRLHAFTSALRFASA